MRTTATGKWIAGLAVRDSVGPHLRFLSKPGETASPPCIAARVTLVKAALTPSYRNVLPESGFPDPVPVLLAAGMRGSGNG